MKASRAFPRLFVVLVTLVGCSSAPAAIGSPDGGDAADGAGSGTSPTGAWRASPIPGAAPNDLMPMTSWEILFAADGTFSFRFNYVFPATARDFARCAASTTASGGTWATVATRGANRLRLSPPHTHTSVRTGCVRATENYAERPTTESVPVELVAGDYPYSVAGNALTLTTGQGPMVFTHE